MAITVDSTGSTKSSVASTVIAFSHTCQGNNRLLVVGVQQGTTIGSAIQATYAGTSMTQQAVMGVGVHVAAIFTLLAPTTGTNTVSITVSSGRFNTYSAESVSFTSVNQTTPIRSTQSTFAASSIATVEVSGLSAGDMVIDSALFTSASAMTTGAGQTLIFASTITNADFNIAGGMSIETATASTITMSWSQVSAGSTYLITAVALIEAVAAAQSQLIWMQ